MSQPESPPPEPVARALNVINELAMHYARKWRLIDDQGQVWCLRDGCQRLATFPSLACEFHLVEHRRGR